MKPYLVIAAALAASAFPASAETLADVERAMEATTTMQATFVQEAYNGVSQGTMQIKRPGRVRFDYDGNKDFLVVADGRRLSFIDYKVGQVTQWPLEETPLGVLLDPKAQLKRIAKVVTGLPTPVPGQVAVEAHDPKRPDQGKILFFLTRDSSAPGGLLLSGWRVTDPQGNVTNVALEDIRVNRTIGNGVFTFRDPRQKSGPPGGLR